MNQQERNLREDLTNHEKDLLNKDFTICDIAWGRINKAKVLATCPKDISNFYYQLHYYLKIFNSNKDYERAAIVAVMIFKFDSSGLDIYALDDNLIKYHTIERAVIATTGIQYIYKHAKYIQLDEVAKSVKDKNILSKNVLPFSYLNENQMMIVFNDYYDRYSQHDFSIKNLVDYSNQFDFSEKTEFLKSKKWLHEDEIVKDWDDIFKELDEME